MIFFFKKFLFLLLLLSTKAYSELYTYNSQYQHIVTGISSIKDIENIHGQPNKVIENTNNDKYIYNDFEVTIQHSTQTVNSIIILVLKIITLMSIFSDF